MSELLEPEAGARDPAHLLHALTEALSVLTAGGDAAAALRESFAHAGRGLGAQKSLLLDVRDADAGELEILYSQGLTEPQKEACRRMESSRGVSPSVIRTALEERQSVFIPNSQIPPGTLRQTASLAEGTHSVLCAPIVDPLTSIPIALVYFQNEGLLGAFREDDEAWLRSYAAALAQGLSLHLHARRVEVGPGESLSERIPSGGPELIGDSPETEGLRQNLHQFLIPAADLPNPKPLLVLGPRGTGKDLVARYVHYYAPRRRRGRFVAFNCAGLRGDLAEARVFGYVKGAFTGADRDAPGLFREADGGVLFLDEIGQLPLEGQALLLRAIESRRVQPVGSSREYPIDVLLLSATNRDLRAEVDAGRFLPDLFDRVRALSIDLKPLAAPGRRSDIRLLLAHFLSAYERAHHKKTLGLDREAALALLNYSWPGNVREVDNLCAALVTYARPGAPLKLSDVVRHVPEVVDPRARHPDADLLADDDASYETALRSWEREFLKRRIERHGSHHTRTMRSLGLPRATYYRILKRCGLKRDGDE